MLTLLPVALLPLPDPLQGIFQGVWGQQAQGPAFLFFGVDKSQERGQAGASIHSRLCTVLTAMLTLHPN